MRYILLGFVVGIIVTLIVIFGWQSWKNRGVSEEATLCDAGKVVVERTLKDAKVLDVVLIHNYKESVDYVYDKMFGIEVKYERNGKVKRIVFPISKYKNNLLSPNNTQIYILDKKAVIIYEPKSPSETP